MITHWPIIRHIRFALSPRWKHYHVAMAGVRSAIDRELPELALSWLDDAKYEMDHLRAIREGKE